MMDKKVAVSTKCGGVIGSVRNGFLEFKGISYAKARRFGHPEPICWDAPRECLEFGKMAMQVIHAEIPWGKALPREAFGEDCLNLNVYVPQQGEAVGQGEVGRSGAADGAAQGLPVLMEVHGGAFQNGSNREHTPEEMIRDSSFIYVSLNYRLGIFGFLPLEIPEINGDSGNLGLMDIMAGIRWVYENISAFGGDPERITLMGSSAGAKAIGALMCTPKLKGYVHQLILSSGGTQSIRDKKTAGIIGDRYMDILAQVTGEEQVPPSMLCTLPADTLIEAQRILCDTPGNTCMFGPVADGIFIPENWEALAKAGTLWEGRAMVGSSRHELAFYKMMNPDFDKKAPEIAKGLLGTNAKLAKESFETCKEAYVREHGIEPSAEVKGELWADILTDHMYRTYSYRLARRLAAKGCPVWQYSVDFLPALHCFDQQLAFREPEPMFFKGEAHISKAKALGARIYDAFVRFVQEGSPFAKADDWPCVNAKQPVQMVWDEASGVCPVKAGDVLENIGEAVFCKNVSTLTL